MMFPSFFDLDIISFTLRQNAALSEGFFLKITRIYVVHIYFFGRLARIVGQIKLWVFESVKNRKCSNKNKN